MISLKNVPSMLLIILATLSPTIWAAEPNESAPPPTFKISAAPLDVSGALWTLSKNEQTFLRRWRPPYAAAIPLSDPTTFFPLIDGRTEVEFPHFLLRRASLSEQQRKFVSDSTWFFVRGNDLTSFRLVRRPPRLPGEPMGTAWYTKLTFPEPPDPNRPQVVLYALTLDDAKKMAEAYVQYAMSVFNDRVRTYEAQIQRISGEIAAGEQKTAELSGLLTATRKSLDELKKTVPYRTTEAALAAIGDLNTTVNTALVDIAGIREKIAAIQKLEAGPPPQVVLDRLREMFVEESVALQGAEARRKMATQLREQAQTFVDLNETLQKTSAEKGQTAADLDEQRKDLTRLQDSLEQTRKEKPEIQGNTITIYPVKWVDDAPTN
jgi:hypothetical protein